jgi:HflK protein
MLPGMAGEAPSPARARSGSVDGSRTIAIARRVARYAFHDLLDDTSYWLALGIVLSALVAAALPHGALAGWLGGGILSLVAMLLLSMPVYTCASSSTPLAAALVLKGLSPGAALVFLIAGPATNLGSVPAVLKAIGVRAGIAYLATVAALALLAGAMLDRIYAWLAIDPRASFGTAATAIPEPVKLVGAVLFAALLAASLRRTAMPPEWASLGRRIGRWIGVCLTARSFAAAAAGALVLIYVTSGIFAVSPGEFAIKTRFGRLIGGDLPPGLHARLPWPVESHRIVDMYAVRRTAFGGPARLSREEMVRAMAPARSVFAPDGRTASGVWFQDETGEDASLVTADANLVDLRSVVHYAVADVRAFALVIADPDMLVRVTAEATLRDAVAGRAIDALYTAAREEIERAVAQRLQAKLDRYGAGIRILSVGLLYVHPPDAVHDAFRDVASAQEDKLRTIDRARAFSVEKVNQGLGEAAAMTEEASAYRQSRVVSARSDAQAFAERTAAYRQAPELNRFRLQLETIDKALADTRKTILPGGRVTKDVDLWLLQPPVDGTRR